MKSTFLSGNSQNQIEVPLPKFRWGTRLVLPLAILLALGGLVAGSLAKSLENVTVVSAVPVVERAAIKRVISTSSTNSGEVVAQAAGWIEPDPFPVYATTLTNGTIEEVLFREGDRVSKGAVLARLIDEDAKLGLERAEAEARAAEEAWEANIESRRAAAVATAMVQETEADLDLARAELDVESALLRDADRILKRRENLVEDGTIAEEEFYTAEARAEAQAARVRAFEQRVKTLAAKLERMRAEEAAAKERLELRTEERRRVELARVALAEAELRVRRLEIHSPIDGMVLERLVEPGSIIMAMPDRAEMARVAALYDPQKLQARVDVPLADAAKIGVGQPAQIVVEVLPDRTFSGVVTRVTNLADIQKNTLQVKVAVNDPAPELKPEMLTRVRFLAMPAVGSEEPVVATGFSVFAPAEAVTDGSAWVVSDFDGEVGKAVRRSVKTTGGSADGWVEIDSGLLPGDMVITSKPGTLQPNQSVRIARSEGG